MVHDVLPLTMVTSGAAFSTSGSAEKKSDMFPAPARGGEGLVEASCPELKAASPRLLFGI